MALTISIHTPTRGVTGIKHGGAVELNGISIHTPTRGVTDSFAAVDGGKDISIHTPTRGVTNNTGHISVHLFISIHTPTRGVTAREIDFVTRFENFNPHSHKGSDQNQDQFRRQTMIFQSTLPQGE